MGAPLKGQEMAKLNLNYDGNPNGAKYKRALDSLALQQGQTPEEIMEIYLRGIAQQMGIDANDDEADQEASLSRSERRAARIADARAEAKKQPKQESTT